MIGWESDVEFFKPEPSAPSDGSPAPALPAFRHIPPSGGISQLLEFYSLEEALSMVTEQHAALDDWIRAQEWSPNPPESCTGYIHARRRMKKCRNRLRTLAVKRGILS